MKVLIAVLIAFGYSIAVVAQDTTHIFLKAGTHMKDLLFQSNAFYYPKFQYGRVVFRDGATSSARMNYNMLSDEMHFIDNKGDTLAIANVQLVKLVTFDKDSFYYDKGFIKLLSSSNNIKLGVKQIYRVVDVQKIGGYDVASSTAAITNYRTLYDGHSVYDLTVKEDLLLKKVKVYCFGDRNNEFSPLSRKSVMEVVPKHESKVRTYLKENEVNYANNTDVEKLYRFISQL